MRPTGNDVRQLFSDARGNRTRGEILDRVAALPSAPDLGEATLRQFECFLLHPPQDGEALRYLSAGLGVPFSRVLREIGYWPPVSSPELPEHPAIDMIEAACAAFGWSVSKLGGGRLVVDTKGEGP